MKYILYVVALILEGIISIYLRKPIPLTLLVYLYFLKDKDYIFIIITGLLYDICYTNIYFLTSFIYYIGYLIINKNKSFIRIIIYFIISNTIYYIAFSLLNLIKASFYIYYSELFISFIYFLPILFIFLILNRSKQHKFKWRRLYE